MDASGCAALTEADLAPLAGLPLESLSLARCWNFEVGTVDDAVAQVVFLPPSANGRSSSAALVLCFAGSRRLRCVPSFRLPLSQQQGPPACSLALQGAGSSGEQGQTAYIPSASGFTFPRLQGYELLGVLAARGTLRRVDLSDTAVQIDMLAAALPADDAHAPGADVYAPGADGGGVLLGGGPAAGGQGALGGSEAAEGPEVAAGPAALAGAQSRVAKLVLSRIG